MKLLPSLLCFLSPSTWALRMFFPFARITPSQLLVPLVTLSLIIPHYMFPYRNSEPRVTAISHRGFDLGPDLPLNALLQRGDELHVEIQYVSYACTHFQVAEIVSPTPSDRLETRCASVSLRWSEYADLS